MNISTLSLPVLYHPSMDILDSTKLQTYQSCPRLFFYEYILGWRSSRPNNHLHFGKCLHLALEHIIMNDYTTDSVVEALDLFNEEYRMEFPEATDDIYKPKIPKNFFDCLIKYIKQYSDDPIIYEVYKTEFGGTISLDDSHKLAFKMDTVLRKRSTGKYCSLEHKSKGGNYIGDNYIFEHLMGIQCGTYTHVLNTLVPPEDVEGVIINCLCFKKTKIPDYILQRFPIHLNNSQMYSWLLNTISWMDRIYSDFQHLSATRVEDDVMTAFPRNGRSCCNWGRTCAFLDLCLHVNNPLQIQNRIPVDMKVEFWNPLEEDLRETLTL